jgi:methionyl-tRNA synthetase
MLMALDLPLPKTLLSHAHWTMDRQKMSKSLGNVADPFEAISKYTADGVRYYMMRNGGIVDDAGQPLVNSHRPRPNTDA